ANGTEGLAAVVPVNSNNVSSLSHIAVDPDEWHTAVIQYTSATDTSTADAGIKMWIDPDDGDAAPDFEILTTAGSMGSFNGDGTFGR
ncbi:MAG: hypothetical protein ACKVHP_00705, partial [Verrucomicrobiales bacterium]